MKRIPGSHMTRRTTMLVPGGELCHALEIICAPILSELVDKQRAAGR
jgi:phosphoribulokinase